MWYNGRKSSALENNVKETISEKYLEFDFLAVLVKTDDIKLLMLVCYMYIYNGFNDVEIQMYYSSLKVEEYLL